MAAPRVLCLFGPTAVGKTAVVSRHLADRAEVISADSMQVYRGLDIGTAKPAAAERQTLPHHLIDIRDPDEQYHAGDFVAAADSLVREITARGKLPVVAGGTAFYFRNFVFGLPGTPQGSAKLRERLRLRLEEDGRAALYEELARVDPETAARISENDTYRVLRALEVFEASGRPLSSFEVPHKPRDEFEFALVGMWRERAELSRRIEARVAGMMEAGLAAEVSRLCREGYRADAPALRGIGYREFFALAGDVGCAFDELPTERLDAVAAEIVRSTRRYAKRQMTFFRRLPGVRWVHADDQPGILAAIG